MTEIKKKSQLIIGPARMSFPWLDKPQPPMEGDGEGKYGLTLLLPPDYDLTPIQKALDGAAIAKWGPDRAKWPRLKYGPDKRIGDCADKSDLAGYLPGWHFIPLTSAGRPGVRNAANTEAISDYKAEVYGGRWCKASANAFAWDTGKGVRGVSLGLNNVQVLAHDARFSSKPAAEDEFEAAAEEMAESGWTG